MGEMSIDYENREAMKALRGKLSERATSSEFNEWMAREICEYIDALLDAQKWRPIDSRSMNGGAYLCKCHWRDQSGHIEEYIVLKWDAASGCWLDWDDNHIKNDVPVAYCEIPLPSPPQEKENGDA